MSLGRRFRFAASDNTTIRSITDSWLPVLKLASLWQFPGLREKALKYLKHEDCMTRLHVARQFGVDDWFLPALKDVIARKEPLTVDEINQLGLDFAVKVIALREDIRGSPLIPRRVFNLIRRSVHGSDYNYDSIQPYRRQRY